MDSDYLGWRTSGLGKWPGGNYRYTGDSLPAFPCRMVILSTSFFPDVSFGSIPDNQEAFGQMSPILAGILGFIVLFLLLVLLIKI